MTAAEAARVRARKGEGDLLRERLMDAAEKLLLEKGHPEAVSVREIAKAADCTPPALYLHFADKDELFYFVCSRRFEEFGASMAEAVAGLTDPVERLTGMGRAYVAYGLRFPEHYRVLFVHHKVAPADVKLEDMPGMQAFQGLVDVVQKGINTGCFREVDAFTASVAIWASIHGAVTLMLDPEARFPMPDRDTLVDLMLDSLLHGLEA